MRGMIYDLNSWCYLIQLARNQFFKAKLKQRMIYKVACVGFGSANMLFIAYLASVAPELLPQTVILDPYLDGGALQRSWPTVRSNTTWGQFIASLAKFKATAAYTAQHASTHNQDEPTFLHVLAKHLRAAIDPYVRQTHFLKATVTHITSEKQSISLMYLRPNKCTTTIQAEKVIFSPGSSPKTMNHSIPTMPLSVALDSRQVGNYVLAGERVVLFGMAHSGVLALKNLVDAGCRVSAVYNTPVPFLFARDGEYDGIKQDAATIADDILAGTFGKENLELISWDKAAEDVQDALLRAKWAIYSTGFENNTDLLVGGIAGVVKKYDPETAIIAGVPGLYGFGIAYPSFSEVGGRKFWDVGIPSFTDHILKTNILSPVSSE